MHTYIHCESWECKNSCDCVPDAALRPVMEIAREVAVRGLLRTIKTKYFKCLFCCKSKLMDK